MGNVKIIAASAGSGKTYRLAYEYVKAVVEDPSVYRGILAVTFTNKATEEMSSRILERLHELAAGLPSPYLDALQRDFGVGEGSGRRAWSETKIRARALEARRLILHDYSHFAVLTIDRFFQRLIRSFIRELGVDVNFNLELETDSLLSMAADALIDESSADDALQDLLFAAARARIDDNKRWNVKEPLMALGRELFGEEYGRTHARVHDSAADRGVDGDGRHLYSEKDGEYGEAGEGIRNADPEIAAKNVGSLIDGVVAHARQARLDMSAKAAEMLSAIRSQGLESEDFKGRSRSLVPYLEKVAKGRFEPLSKAAAEALESGGDPAGWVAKTSANRGLVESLIPVLQPLLESLDEIYNNNLRLVNSASLLSENWHNFLLLNDLQQRVERICTEQNIMPIAETNRMIARLVGGNDTPFIFERAGNHFSRFMIDEFQDTSTSQWENFVPLLKNAISEQPGTPVMLIGDIKQAIYRWRGGDWRILSHRVRREMGAERVEKEELDTNFRSARRIVEFTGEVVGLMVNEGNANLNLSVDQAVAGGMIGPEEAAGLTDLLATAYKNHVQRPVSERDEGYVTLTVYGSDEAGEFVPPVVEKVAELLSRGYAEGDIAILVRSNEQGARVARMLLAAGHQIVTQEALRVGSAEVSRFIIACLSLAADPSDAVQRAIFNHWLYGRGYRSMQLHSRLQPYAQSRFPSPTQEQCPASRPCSLLRPQRLSPGAFESPVEPHLAFFSRLAALSPEEAFEEIVLHFGLADQSAEVAYIQALHQQIVTFSARSVADIPLFLKWWNERGADASITMQGGRRAITVSTIHKSKGLEYKAVIIPYLSWKTSPGQGIVWAEGEWADSGTTTGRENATDDENPPAGFLTARPAQPTAGLPLIFPLNFKDQMADSFFAARFYREQVLSHIDAVNMFYVAATRAEKELHLMTSGEGSRLPKNAIGSILCRVLGVSAAAAGKPLDVIDGVTATGVDRAANGSPGAVCSAQNFRNAGDVSVTTWGSPVFQGGVEAAPGESLKTYPTSRPDTKIRLKLPSNRYFQEEAAVSVPENMAAGTGLAGNYGPERPLADRSPKLSPRDFGVLMHRAFESAATAEDVQKAIAKMAANATVSHSECVYLQQVIARAFEDPLVAGWFSGEWDSVRNEGDILAPRDPSVKRPDRVMTRGGKAVVVDYKFGAGESAAHSGQLRGYMRLLRDMGCTTVEGYIWYVSLGKIVPVI